MSKKKNRYCGYLSWVDGEYLEEDKFFVMGFEMKKSNETKLAKDFQKKVLQMVASLKTEDEVTDYARNLYKITLNGTVDYRTVIKRSRLRNAIEDYKMIAGGSAGVLYYNEQNIGEIKVGDSYYFYNVKNKMIKGYPRRYEYQGRIRDVEYIACKKIDEVIENFPINWERIADSEIVKKVTLVYDSLGWNVNEITQTGKQTSLSEW